MAFDPRVIPEIIWRCPICGEEETLQLHKKRGGLFGSKPVVVCGNCKARWEELNQQSMTLVEGEESLKGKRSIAEWATHVFSDDLELSPKKDIDTSVLLHRDEGIIRKVEAAVYPVGRLGPVRSTGRRYHLAANSFKLPQRNPLPKVEPVDYGELVLTNQRVVFDGSRRVLSMELAKLVSVEVRNRFLELGYGDHKYAFRPGNDSPFKWKTYIEATFQESSDGKEELRARHRRTRETKPREKAPVSKKTREEKKEKFTEEVQTEAESK